MTVKSHVLHIWLLVIVLTVNLFFRLHDIGTFSLSNDELSAISRLDYTSFTELIDKGVIRTDPHPAGVQLFLYVWKSFFGTGVLAIRLPFVLSGLLALIFLFLTFRHWFGSQNALFIVTCFSLLEFTMIHGQLARPYAFGILSTAIFVYTWTRWLFADKAPWWVGPAYIISGLTCLYIHYFAGLFAGLVGVLGLFFVFRKGRFLSYVLLNGAILVGFLPHLPITLAQFSRGGLVDWIPPVEIGFILEHIGNVLNGSVYVIALCATSFLVGLWFIRRTTSVQLRFWFISILLFLMPILIGFIYSNYGSNALMDRVLYFSSPYLVASFFGLLPEVSRKFQGIIFGFLLVAITCSSVIEKRFVSHQYTENFRDIARHLSRIEGENMLYAGNYNSLAYVNYYMHDQQVEFDINKINNDSLLASYMKMVRESHKSALSLSWACTYQPIEAVEYTRRFFPDLSDQASFYNSGFWLMTKNNSARDTLLHDMPLVKLELADGCADVNSGKEFFDLAKYNMTDLREPEVLNILIRFRSENAKGIKLVCEMRGEEGKKMKWIAKDFNDFNLQSGLNDLMFSIKLSDIRDANELIVYIWNPEGSASKICYAQITAFTDSNYPGLY